MSQKLPINNFAWIEDTSQFHEDLIKNYNDENDERYFEKLQELHNGLPFLSGKMKIKKSRKAFFLIYFIKLNMLST